MIIPPKFSFKLSVQRVTTLNAGCVYTGEIGFFTESFLPYMRPFYIIDITILP